MRPSVVEPIEMNVSLWINLAVACISPPIGTSQVDPKPSFRMQKRMGCYGWCLALGQCPLHLLCASRRSGKRAFHVYIYFICAERPDYTVCVNRGNAFMADITLWGFGGSTYVRTIKMLFAEKGVTQFKQVPLNVLEGEPKKPEHLERHPFGKVRCSTMTGCASSKPPRSPATSTTFCPASR
jgi:glutathione S-transferase-like protein